MPHAGSVGKISQTYASPKSLLIQRIPENNKFAPDHIKKKFKTSTLLIITVTKTIQLNAMKHPGSIK